MLWNIKPPGSAENVNSENVTVNWMQETWKFFSILLGHGLLRCRGMSQS